jgi:hypothetical protein
LCHETGGLLVTVGLQSLALLACTSRARPCRTAGAPVQKGLCWLGAARLRAGHGSPQGSFFRGINQRESNVLDIYLDFAKSVSTSSNNFRHFDL